MEKVKLLAYLYDYADRAKVAENFYSERVGNGDYESAQHVSHYEGLNSALTNVITAVNTGDYELPTLEPDNLPDWLKMGYDRECPGCGSENLTVAEERETENIMLCQDCDLKYPCDHASADWDSDRAAKGVDFNVKPRRGE